MADRQVHSGDLPSLIDEPWVSVTKSAEDALAGLTDADLADLLDYRLDRLVRWKNGGNSLAFHPLGR